MRNILTSLAAGVLLVSCAMPETAVKTGSPRPTLAIKGAPAGATLFVDGLPMGAATDYDANPKVLIVEEGIHKVEIRQSNSIIHTEKAFVSGGELKTITINTGGR